MTQVSTTTPAYAPYDLSRLPSYRFRSISPAAHRPSSRRGVIPFPLGTDRRSPLEGAEGADATGLVDQGVPNRTTGREDVVRSLAAGDATGSARADTARPARSRSARASRVIGTAASGWPGRPSRWRYASRRG